MITKNLRKYISLKNFILALLVFNFLTFSLLLLKNPFSERNLISNLEPYPDTIHYIAPALSLIHSKGFNIQREGRSFTATVPFLYSAVLTPFFIINSDARVFYFANIIIAVGGAVFFYIFLKRITFNKFIPLLVLFFYVTNYFVYWYPTLAMAENLGLGLFMLSIFLITSKFSSKNAVLAGILAVSFYATKYAYITLSAVFVLAYFLKILTEEKLFSISNKKINSKILKAAVLFISSLIISVTVYFLLEYLIRGGVVFQKIQSLLSPLLNTSVAEQADPISTNSWFSYSYFQKNFQVYLNAVFGDSMRFLWDYTPLLPKYLALLSIAGLLMGLFIKWFRIISLYLISSIIIPILFLSTFYSNDARYIFNAIPALLGGLAIILNVLYQVISKKKQTKIFYLGLIILFAFYSFQSFSRIKYQIVLNLKYAETPWNYISVKTFNEFFDSRNIADDKKPILITALQPYYIDFFSHGQFKLLPLSKDQEFTGMKEFVWGHEDYSDFTKLYKKYLDENREVYVTNASLGNEGYLYLGYDLIKANFDLELAHQGCLDTCNIYRLKEKQE